MSVAAYTFAHLTSMQLQTIRPGTPQYEEMAALRIRVLLDPIGAPHSYVDPKKEAGDILIGAYEAGVLIGCCVLTQKDESTAQLRQMAVDSATQQKGVGRAIVACAEGLAKANGYCVLMMHARDAVLGFYRKCGYEVVGEGFVEAGIPHHLMQKELS